MRVRVAYLEEPPFYGTDGAGSAAGADIELAEVVLRAFDASAEFHLVAFEDLLPGVAAGRWEMNVPIFVTPARAERVAFSVPVWSLGDGLVVRRGNPRELTSYESVALHDASRLGVIPGQVQVDAAKAAGIDDAQLVSFIDQPDAVAALLSGEIDAFAATEVGNRRIVQTHPELESVAVITDGTAPVGAFSFATENDRLLEAVNAGLRAYLGTEDHRTRMAAYGITGAEIDPVL